MSKTTYPASLIALIEFRELAVAWLARPKEITARVHPLTWAFLNREGVTSDSGRCFGNGAEITQDPAVPQGRIRLSYKGQHATIPVDLNAGIDPPRFTPRGGILGAGAECLTCGSRWCPAEGTTLEDCVAALVPIAEDHRAATGGHQVRIGVQYTLAGKSTSDQGDLP